MAEDEVEAFRTRPLGDTAYPYLWLDATYLEVREGGRVVSTAALVAVGVALTGERRVLGLELSPGNDEGPAWPAFVRRLVERGLQGVRLVISDDHAGLVKAVREQLLGASWQRCRVHFTRNAQDLVPRSARSMVASAIRLVFEQPDEASAREQCSRVIAMFEPPRTAGATSGPRPWRTSMPSPRPRRRASRCSWRADQARGVTARAGT